MQILFEVSFSLLESIDIALYSGCHNHLLTFVNCSNSVVMTFFSYRKLSEEDEISCGDLFTGDRS